MLLGTSDCRYAPAQVLTRALSWGLTDMRRSACLAFAAATLAGCDALACSVPVFRYALERWEPDPYRIIVPRSTDLTQPERASVARLRQFGRAAKLGGVANLEVVADAEADAARSPAEGLVLLPPARLASEEPVLTWKLSEENVDALCESPARTRIAEGLLEGDSAVWILLTGPEPEKNRVAKESLAAALREAEETLTLPEIVPADLEEENLKLSAESVRIGFSVVEVARDDPAEAALVQMLLASEPDLRDAEFASEPMAFPVFGRGRVLYALIGRGINESVVSKACAFLVGACQCTVKSDNPGVDLLMNVDWQSRITPGEAEEFGPSELVGLSGFGAPDATPEGPTAEGVAVVVEDAASSEAATLDVEGKFEAEPESGGMPLGVVGVFAGMVAVVGLLSAGLLWKGA